MILVFFIIILITGIALGYWYFYTEYSTPHFKGRKKISDLEDAILCLWKFGYHGASLEIKQSSIIKYFVIIKYINQERFGLELPIPLNYWNDEDLGKMKKYCESNNIKIIEINASSVEEGALYFDCEANIDAAAELSKFLCLDILKMKLNDQFDYCFDALSVYEEFPSIADHPNGWNFNRHTILH